MPWKARGKERVAAGSSISPTGCCRGREGTLWVWVPMYMHRWHGTRKSIYTLARFLGLPRNWQCDLGQISNSLILGFLIYPGELEFLHSAIIRIASSKHLRTTFSKLGRYQLYPTPWGLVGRLWGTHIPQKENSYMPIINTVKSQHGGSYENTNSSNG